MEKEKKKKENGGNKHDTVDLLYTFIKLARPTQNFPLTLVIIHEMRLLALVPKLR